MWLIFLGTTARVNLPANVNAALVRIAGCDVLRAAIVGTARSWNATKLPRPTRRGIASVKSNAGMNHG